MAESILNNEFDMEEYINHRLLEVKSLEDRVILKDVLSDMFLEMYNHVENEYTLLENRVFDEVDQSIAPPVIITGIIDKSYYDETETSLFPMDMEDLEERIIDEEKLKESLEAGVPFFAYSIFIETDYLKLKSLLKKERLFLGTVKTNDSEYKATIMVKASTRYLEKIKKLYEICIVNSVPWHTVCTPYLHKMFDVYITKIDGLKDLTSITEVKVDFEEYEGCIHYDIVPVWNINEEEKKTSAFPEACVDKIYYEHQIFATQLSPDKDYLVADQESEIVNVRRIQKDLHITCNATDIRKWTLYAINPVPEKRRKYPLMSNSIKKSFSNNMRQQYLSTIKTKGELIRYIHSLGYEDYVTIKDIETAAEDFIEEESYNMDAFIEDEIRLDQKAHQLILSFQTKKADDYLVRDIMSYMVSCVAYIYPEYHCIGRLV